MTVQFTHAEFLDEAKRRFGQDPLDIAFICPACGDVAALREFTPDNRGRAGQECIGRSLGALSDPQWTGRGCNFAAYGLIPGPWAIVMDDGREVRSFPLADRKTAQEATRG